MTGAMKTRKLLAIAAGSTLLLATPLRINGQYTLLDLPRGSQVGTTIQRIGITDISVTYGRPAAKGRTIWGELVPYGQVWRAGANENTVLTTTHEITVEGTKLPAGSYGLHMIPTENSWTIIFSTDHTAWGSFFYKPENDALRATVAPRKGPAVEDLTFAFDEVHDQGATLVMRWAGLEVPIKMAVDVHGVVLAGMDAQLRGLSAFSWESWYEAAHYCHQEKTGGDKVLKWLDRSIALRPNFENQQLKADVLTEQGRTAEAATLRRRALEVATNAELNQYGYSLLNQGKKTEAVKVFEANAKRHPDDPNVHDSLGEGYMMNGQKDAAVKSFKKALAMNPLPGVRANSIKCLKQLGVDTSAWEKG